MACRPQSSASRPSSPQPGRGRSSPRGTSWSEGSRWRRARERRMRSTRGRSRSNPEPPLHVTTFFTGQPKLISTISKPRSWQWLAASAITAGSAPKSCAEMGCSSGSKYRYRKVRVGLVAVDRSDDAMGAGELGHDEPAAALGADQAAKDRVGDAGHGREHGRRRDGDTSDAEVWREPFLPILTMLKRTSLKRHWLARHVLFTTGDEVSAAGVRFASRHEGSPPRYYVCIP